MQITEPLRKFLIKSATNTEKAVFSFWNTGDDHVANQSLNLDNQWFLKIESHYKSPVV